MNDQILLIRLCYYLTRTTFGSSVLILCSIQTIDTTNGDGHTTHCCPLLHWYAAHTLNQKPTLYDTKRKMPYINTLRIIQLYKVDSITIRMHLLGRRLIHILICMASIAISYSYQLEASQHATLLWQYN